jgi:hypothetical protein
VGSQRGGKAACWQSERTFATLTFPERHRGPAQRAEHPGLPVGYFGRELGKKLVSYPHFLVSRFLLCSMCRLLPPLQGTCWKALTPSLAPSSLGFCAAAAPHAAAFPHVHSSQLADLVHAAHTAQQHALHARSGLRHVLQLGASVLGSAGQHVRLLPQSAQALGSLQTYGRRLLHMVLQGRRMPGCCRTWAAKWL